jgi:hypothetical protein
VSVYIARMSQDLPATGGNEAQSMIRRDDKATRGNFIITIGLKRSAFKTWSSCHSVTYTL